MASSSSSSTSTSTSPLLLLLLSRSYRLERLVVRSASYIYESDKDHSYVATVDALDTATGNTCSQTSPDAVEINFALHIANRFRTTLCFTPQQQDNNNNSTTEKYHVQMMGPMMSTRMMPIDEEVQQLEQRWDQAASVITRATVDGRSPRFLRFTDDEEDDAVEIVFREVSTDEENIGEGEE